MNSHQSPTMNTLLTASKRLVRGVFDAAGLDIRRSRPGSQFRSIPDADMYRPLFAPWHGEESARYYSIAAPRTLVSPDRCYVLQTLLAQALTVEGEVWECGVYQGGTAAMLAAMLSDRQSDKPLRLFDTFAGMPETDPRRDLHSAGDFADTSAEAVAKFVGPRATLHPGWIPQSFAGLEDRRIALAHIDVDIYQSIMDCLHFIWPRLSPGGFIVFDDYGFPSCPGARSSVDEFFRDKASKPLCLHTGQALVFKGAGI